MTRKLRKRTCYFFIATDELQSSDRICSKAVPAAVLLRCGSSLSSNIKSFGTFIS